MGWLHKVGIVLLAFDTCFEISSLDVLQHHLGKLLVRDFSIAVGVHLLDDRFDNLLIQVLAEGQHLLDLFDRDGTTSIFVEHFESCIKLVVRKQVLLVQSGNNEF